MVYISEVNKYTAATKERRGCNGMLLLLFVYVCARVCSLRECVRVKMDSAAEYCSMRAWLRTVQALRKRGHCTQLRGLAQQTKVMFSIIF